ncbi:MAG TPA: DUF5063 domain-containing protein [Bacteroidales bacterium]|nr:DUF5063 domain-containing protein [Bacteroidales bacterium]HPT20353.1 DUF5063 domain-containing protein [Bacteroidales bacterium]
MGKNVDPVYSRNVIEFVAVANEFCKYAERASEVKGDELLKILQRILPLLYLKATLLPQLSPFFEDGNEKFVTESDWIKIDETLKDKFGTADDYLEVFDEKIKETEGPVVSSISENMADIYQDLKDFLLLYQTGTGEVMNDAVWECRMNFENFWGQKLTNAMRAIHKFIYSGEEIGKVENDVVENDERRDTSDWFITRRQKDFRGERG